MERREVSTLLRIQTLLLECGVPAAHLAVLDFHQSAKERRKAVVRLVGCATLSAPGNLQVRLARLLRNLLERPYPRDMP